MLDRTRTRAYLAAIAMGVASLGVASSASAQTRFFWEDFSSASGTPGKTVLQGAGYSEVADYDSDLQGEWAFAGTWGDGTISDSFAVGVPNANPPLGVGQIEVTGPSYTDGGYFAGLFWDEIHIPPYAPASLEFMAAIADAPVGADLELRIEANSYLPYGLNEDFGTVDATGPVTYFDESSSGTGSTDNWNEGLRGEEAFAGIDGAGFVDVGGGVTAEGLLSGGNPGPAGQLSVANIVIYPNTCNPDSPNPGDPCDSDTTCEPGTCSNNHWYAGVMWRNQVLPTTDLSLVSLTADVMGTANGGTLGDYMLRLEDNGGDFLLFRGTANGAWQDVGGPLSTAEEGGFGDGIFDVDASPFTVVLVFDNDTSNTWGNGGNLKFDNIFLSGGSTRQTLGAVTFNAEATGGAQILGGFLADGDSTLGNVNEDFEQASGEGGGVFFDPTSGGNGYTESWDSIVSGEAAFAGVWGGQVTVGSASAQAILSEGNPSKAGELLVQGMSVPGVGGWWAGLMWPYQQLPAGPLSGITLRADIRGEAVIGGSRGQYILSIEDADQDALNFYMLANGGYQTVGGLLSTAIEEAGQGPDSDGDFDENRGPFTVIVRFTDEWNGWGAGGRLRVDNLSLTDVPFGYAVESWSLFVSMAVGSTAARGGVSTLSVDEVEIAGKGGSVPAVSQWSLVVTALLVLTYGTVVIGRRRRLATG